MLLNRDSDPVRCALLLQESLVEGDEAERRAERAGRGGDISGHIRAAAMRLRRARGVNDAHAIGVDLYRQSPEAHEALVRGMGDHPHRLAVAAAPHLHTYDRLAREAYDNRYGPRNLQRLADRDRALEKVRHAAEDHGDGNHGKLIPGWHDEDMSDHLDRVYHHAHMRHYHGPEEKDGHETHEGVFSKEESAQQAAEAARSHYGKTHDVGVQRRGDRWHVTTRRKRRN